MYGATWSLLLKISFKFFLKTFWKCLIQDGEEFPCHTVSNVIDLFPSVDCSTSKFSHLVYSYLSYHLTWQVNKIFRLRKKNKTSRQPTSIWKFSQVIISASLSCLLERRTLLWHAIWDLQTDPSILKGQKIIIPVPDFRF